MRQNGLMSDKNDIGAFETSPDSRAVDTHNSEAILVASMVPRFVLPTRIPLRLERLDPARAVSRPAQDNALGESSVTKCKHRVMGASQTSVPSRLGGNPTASSPGALQKGPGAASAVANDETSPDPRIVDTHNSGASIIASVGDFTMRSLASVLIPRQLLGGSGPEPAANPRV